MILVSCLLIGPRSFSTVKRQDVSRRPTGAERSTVHDDAEQGAAVAARGVGDGERTRSISRSGTRAPRRSRKCEPKARNPNGVAQRGRRPVWMSPGQTVILTVWLQLRPVAPVPW